MKRNLALAALIVFFYCKCVHASVPCNLADPGLKTEGQQIYQEALKEYKLKKGTKDPRALQPIQDEYPWRMIRSVDLQYQKATGRLP